MTNTRLTPATDAEAQLVALLESGDARPEFVRQELARRMGDFHDAVSAADPEAAIPSRISTSVEVAGEPLVPMSFVEL